MNNHGDSELERVLRRAADHLVQRGSEYREHPVVETRSTLPTAIRQRAVGLRVLAASAVAASLAVGGVMAFDQAPAAQRLESGSLSVPVSDPSASDGSGAATDTSVRDPLSTDLADDPYLEPSEPIPVEMPPDGSVPSVITVPPPYATLPVVVEGPQISDVEVPSVVQAGETATFRWRVRDVDSVSSTGIVVGWASGIYTPCGFGQSARLESGSSLDGTWVFRCLIPNEAVSTEYSVDVHAQDALGNWSSIGGYTFTVQGGSPDSSPPVASAVRVVGVARAGEILTTTWTLTDDSGVDGAVLWVAGPGGAFSDLDTGLRYVQYDTMQVTRQCSSTGVVCEFTQTVRIDPASPVGTYTLWSSATDTLGNKHLMPVLTFSVTG